MGAAGTIQMDGSVPQPRICTTRDGEQAIMSSMVRRRARAIRQQEEHETYRRREEVSTKTPNGPCRHDLGGAELDYIRPRHRASRMDAEMSGHVGSLIGQ